MNLNEKPNAIEAKIIQTVEAVAEEGRAARWSDGKWTEEINRRLGEWA